MNNYFIIGKVNEGKSFLFNLFSKTHKTISNPKANTTIDVIRKNILSENYEYNIYDTPGFYKFSDFKDLLNKISILKLDNIHFIYLISSFTNEDFKIEAIDKTTVSKFSVQIKKTINSADLKNKEFLSFNLNPSQKIILIKIKKINLH